MTVQIIKLTSMSDGSFEELDSDRKWMPVPRCSTCKHWGTFEDMYGKRQCVLPAMNDGHWLDSEISEIMTASNFGCVQWEKKS